MMEAKDKDGNPVELSAEEKIQAMMAAYGFSYDDAANAVAISEGHATGDLIDVDENGEPLAPEETDDEPEPDE